MKEATEKSSNLGRPKIAIDWDVIGNLCKIQCTGEEIAFALGLSYDTLMRRCVEDFGYTFRDFLKKNAAYGKASLRHWQWKSAKRGNWAAQKWLGIQYLNQRIQPELDEDDPEDESELPTFTVKMSRGGKFKTVRPVRKPE